MLVMSVVLLNIVGLNRDDKGPPRVDLRDGVEGVGEKGAVDVWRFGEGG